MTPASRPPLSGPSLALGALACAALAAMLAAVGCEAIVPASAATPSCTMTPYVDPGNGTCPAGMYCEGAGCKACESKDFCDGYDNDCDGIIDDGPYSDKDGDGFTNCGKVDPNKGLIDVDCRDDDAKVYPGADEICNGIDDNCDGIIDNPTGPYAVCPPGETCVPQTGLCISNTAACVTCAASPSTPGCCAAPNVCDPGTQECVPPGTQDAGTTCSGNLACTTGICSDGAELGPNAPAGTAASCTTPCCTSADCDRGSVCWGGGTGGNYCISATAAGRTTGTGLPGATCGTGSECYSGVCTASKCEDTCCTNTNCTNGTTCAVTTLAGATTLACTTAGATTPNNTCSASSACASDYCATYCYNESCSDNVQLCAQPCCSSNQCGSYEGNQFVCNDDYFPALTASSTGTPPAGTPVVPVCDAVQQTKTVGGPPPTGQVGATCTSITDCYSNLCTATGTTPGYCTDVCCVDSDCNAAGYVCRPTPTATGTNLRCVPNP